ncbi:hypothetical protein [Dulcicalothrix desertica]|uniref:hypothetical protein n=1 Tax=Dulcicalothrix desertica TaxID=32056 RepID=UPI0011A9402C|nr:hypothetical protein [Dulcicalothrix desertica]
MAFKLLLFLGSVVCGFFLAADLYKITSPPENVKLFWKNFKKFFRRLLKQPQTPSNILFNELMVCGATGLLFLVEIVGGATHPTIYR